MSGIDSVSDAVTGGLAARATEPGTGVDATGHTTEQQCLNCRTALIGTYCHACGQKGHVHRTLGAFAHDLFHGVFHFEGKVWRTVPMLAWRPGELTRRYVLGERSRYVSPVALFLFSVFLMFAVFGALGGPVRSDSARQVQLGMAESVRAQKQRLAELEQQRSALAGSGQPTAAVDSEIADTRGELAIMSQVEREGFLVGVGHRIVDDLPNGFWKRAVEKFNSEPALTLYKLQANSYKFSWLLIPLSVPLVWLLFLWRPRHWQLYNHVIFVTYSLSFQTLLLVTFTLLAHAGIRLGWLLSAAAVIISLHLYRQLRGAYGLRPLSALWRMVALSSLWGLAFALFLLALIAIGAAG
jgi:hypothetical protein